LQPINRKYVNVKQEVRGAHALRIPLIGNKKKRGKLQITEELYSGLRKTKVGCCNKYLVLDTVRNKWTTPPAGEELYENLHNQENFNKKIYWTF
jgi:hypothetical protein